MSIGIVLATTDTILLVADGRQSTAYEKISDTVEKISVLRSDLALISFGVNFGTQRVLQWMKHEELPLNADEFSKYLSDRVHASGTLVLQALRVEDRTSDRMKVGFVGGGADATGPYITGSLFGANMESVATVTSRCVNSTFVYIVLGGENAGAETYFQQLSHRLLTDETPPQAVIPTLLHVAIQTIRFAASADQSIGGQIQYTILERGKLPQTGFLV